MTSNQNKSSTQEPQSPTHKIKTHLTHNNTFEVTNTFKNIITKTQSQLISLRNETKISDISELTKEEQEIIINDIPENIQNTCKKYSM